MKYKNLVIDVKGEKHSFKVNSVYDNSYSLLSNNLLTNEEYARLNKLIKSKFKGVTLKKNSTNGILKITFYNTNNLNNFYLEQEDNELISLNDYINLNIMMSTRVVNNIFYDIDMINEAHISFINGRNKVVFVFMTC